MSSVIRHVAESIGPASRANAEAARAAVAHAGAPMLDRLAAALGGAQHQPRPRADKTIVVVAAGDHGVGDPGIAMGADHPTIIAAREIAAGTAALNQLARAARTPVVLIDAGAKESAHMPATAVALGRGATRDLMREPAMTIVDATLGIEAGIALAMSLLEPDPMASPRGSDANIGAGAHTGAGSNIDSAIAAATSIRPNAPAGFSAVLAIGAIGVGAEVASAALLGAITGRVPRLGDDQAELAGHRGIEHRRFATEPITEPLPTLAGWAEGSGALPPQHADDLEASALELLATFGGSETAVLVGLLLGAASINVPVILDSYATGAAALIAARIAPNITGYLVAAHRGSFTMPAILDYLKLQPIFEVGLGHGEGSGAAMVLPLVEQVAVLAAPRV
ncbi:MAG: nicotinate-nucleotide--dimethylbenzimidazole phosphoribosyltransferase [Kofleriaceae bacterium]